MVENMTITLTLTLNICDIEDSGEVQQVSGMGPGLQAGNGRLSAWQV